MRKFTNIHKAEKIHKPHEIVLKETIKAIINENISIGTKNEEIITMDTSILGLSDLENNINDYIAKIRNDKKNKVIENINLVSHYHINESLYTERINNIKNILNESNIVSSPVDVFSKNDYIVEEENCIVLENLENVPVDYFTSFLNESDINKYFKDGNKIKIDYKGIKEGWEMEFIPELKNKIGTMNERKISFMSNNIDFISDFTKSARNLIGEKNLKIKQNDK